MAQIDLRGTTIRFSDGGSNYLDVKIGEGSCDYVEKREIEVVDNRGKLDTMRENKEIPVEVSMTFVWEFLLGTAGDPPTVEDVLRRRGEAASWVSASSDSDAPYCINISILYIPPCEGIDKETITLSQFNHTELSHVLRDGTVALKGICNVKAAQLQRIS